jgi:hypothetical protein
MPDSIRKVDYYYTRVPHKPGEGAKILKILKDAGVNLLAFHAFPEGGQAQLDFVPENADALTAAAKGKFQVSGKKTAFLVDGADRLGAVHEILDRLAGAGVNLIAMDAVRAGSGRFGALLWVAPADAAKAAKALGA